jgi:hypothetical protein
MADRSFSETEQKKLERLFLEFVHQWTAHDKQLKASIDLLYGRFVVVMVDESFNGVSGCGIDKSVNFLKAIAGDFKVDFFNRLLVAYKKDEQIRVVNKHFIPNLLLHGDINEDSLVFNNMVQTKEQFDLNWLIALKNTWLARYLNVNA